MNEETFASIVDETKGVVLSAIRKNLFSEYYYAIDDVVQETYIRAYRSLVKKKFNENSKLSSWLYVIAKNESIRMSRKLKRGEKRREKYAEDRMDILRTNEISIIEEKLERNEQVQMVREGISELPDEYRDVLSLYIKGFNEKEISEFLSIPRGTVKSRAYRGKKILKEVLSEEGIHGKV